MKILAILLMTLAVSSCVQPWFPFSNRIEGAGLLEPRKERDEPATVTIEIDWPEDEE